MSDTQNHALVFGATGLLGWAVVDQLLAGYPNAGSFTRVTAVSNRPVNALDTMWPSGSSGSPVLQLVSGVNLQEEDVEEQLRGKIFAVDEVTHVFYFVFAPDDREFERECEVNCGMMRRVAGAVNGLCPRLESFVYSGGTRGYGIYIPGGTFKAPLKESIADQLPADYAKTVAYPWFRKILTEAGNDRAWTWCEVCPDAVVGFSPIGSNFSLALHWAQYLSLYAHEHGAKAEVPFPGSEGGYDSLFTPVSSRSLGRIAVHAGLSMGRCGGMVVNMMDCAEPTSFRRLWPDIAGWFGLIGTSPSEESDLLPPSEYIEKHKHLFEENGLPKAVVAGVGSGSKQLDSVGAWLTFDRYLSPERLREVGYTEERAPIEGWLETFEKLRAAGIIF